MPHHHYNDVRSKIFFYFFFFVPFFFFLPNTIIMEMGAIIWLKMSHFQPKNGPHPHYNDVRSIFFFFFFFLEEKKKNNLGPPLVALECHKNICNHFSDKSEKSGTNSIQTQNYACKAQVINTIIY